jgi:hypothetical protein
MDTLTRPWGTRAVLAVVSTTAVVASLCCARPAAAQERLAPAASGRTLDLGHPDAAPDASSLEDYRSPVVAARLSTWFTLGPLLGGLTMVIAAANRSGSSWAQDAAILGGASMAFGLTLGPSVGYAYSGEHLRGWGVGVLRLVGLTVGTYVLASAVLENAFCEEDCSQKDTSGPAILGLTMVIASMISAIYDIAKAPDAARRSNARNGLSDLNLVPVVAASGPAAFRGLALAGRF